MAVVFLLLALCMAAVYLVGFSRAIASLTPEDRERVRNLGNARRNLAMVVPIFLAMTLFENPVLRFAGASMLFALTVVGGAINRRRLTAAQLPQQFIQRQRRLSNLAGAGTLLLAMGLGMPLFR
jgi:hypothetical protein